MKLEGSTPKRFGQRAIAPDETWRLVQPLCREAGITRVASITGLDRIGIPVWIAVRPNSRGLSNSQGKGLDHASARTSALMEALEAWHAERPTIAVRMVRERDLEAEGMPRTPSARLPRAQAGNDVLDHVIPWTCGTDLLSGAPTWVPYEMVHADTTLPRFAGSGAFVVSTNGLASGNTPSEAILHALCEVVERDATSLWVQVPIASRRAFEIDAASCDHPGARWALQRIQSAGLEVTLWNITSDVGVPVIRAMITDRSPHLSSSGVVSAYGIGCHPDRDVAVVRALTEAAQSRLTAVAGARDDLEREHFRIGRQAAAAGVAEEGAPRMSIGDLPSFLHDTVEDDVREILNRLAPIAGPVVAIDLSRPGWPIHVWRVVAAGLEGIHETRHYLPQQRAQAAMRRWHGTEAASAPEAGP
jgi:ribosomal protein S12 methylthiotransferase accessory factor